MMDGRVRRSWGSVERQTRQEQPMVGTPIEVPLPSTVRVAFIESPEKSSSSCAFAKRGRTGPALRELLQSGVWINRALRGTGKGVRDLDVSHAQFIQHVLHQGVFGGGEIALCLLSQNGYGVDRLAR